MTDTVKPFLTHEHPIRFAHRGSRVLWPENTMVAFQGAVDLGYRYLETDVHTSRDGQVLVFHDDRLERVTDGRGVVWDHDWEHLRRLDAAYRFRPADGHPLRGAGVRIPLLEELLTAFPDALLNIDLKQDGVEAAVAEVVRRHDAEDRVLVGSFEDRRVARFRELAGERVATSAGSREIRAAYMAALRGGRFTTTVDALQIPDRHRIVPVAVPRFVEAIHDAGVPVHVWTVNSPRRMRRLLDLGVDGIMTDRPDLLAEVLVERDVSGG